MITSKNLNKRLKSFFGYLFLYQRKTLNSYRLRKRIKKSLKLVSKQTVIKNDGEYHKQVRQFLKSNFHGYRQIEWHQLYYSLSNIKSIDFIPDEIFFNCFELILNKRDFAYVLSDKISYDTLFHKKDLPETVFKLINGRFYSSENYFLEREKALIELYNLNKKVIIKPSVNSGGGRNIVVDNSRNLCSLLKRKEYLIDSYIIQEFVQQHPLLERFHATSLNTCRIMTAKVDEEIVILSAFLRTGRDNSIIDNGQAGGILCGINSNGFLGSYGINNKFEKFYTHPNSKIKFAGAHVPNYNQASQFCIENHKKFLRFTFISWDIAIDYKGNPIFIEFNPRSQGIHNHQILNGPLLGEYTSYFIKRYHEEKNNVLPPDFVI